MQHILSRPRHPHSHLLYLQHATETCKCTPAKCYHCAENHLASDPKCVITSALRGQLTPNTGRKSRQNAEMNNYHNHTNQHKQNNQQCSPHHHRR